MARGRHDHRHLALHERTLSAIWIFHRIRPRPRLVEERPGRLQHELQLVQLVVRALQLLAVLHQLHDLLLEPPEPALEHVELHVSIVAPEHQPTAYRQPRLLHLLLDEAELPLHLVAPFHLRRERLAERRLVLIQILELQLSEPPDRLDRVVGGFRGDEQLVGSSSRSSVNVNGVRREPTDDRAVAPRVRTCMSCISSERKSSISTAGVCVALREASSIHPWILWIVGNSHAAGVSGL